MRAIRSSLVVLGLLTLQTPAVAEDTSKATTTSRPSVIVAPVTKQDVSKQKAYVGRVQATKTVNLVARVEGFLEERKFTEGSIVEKDQLLYVIEQTSYKAALEQAEAGLEGNEATLKNNQIEYDRNKNLAATNDVTQETLDSSKATLDVSKSNVKSSKADVTNAELNLSYTEIRSPMKGRISATNINVGNLVDSSTGTLATIVSIDPIYVTFYAPESDVLKARDAGLVKGKDVPLTPHLQLSDGRTYPHPGKLDYLGVQVDQNTDTIELRAVFPNPDQILVPGQFVNVTVKTDATNAALVIPQAAMQQDQTGYYVLLVDQDDKVVKRMVKLGDQVGTNWIVTDGLKPGERIIVEGIQKVAPGEVVNAVEKKA